MKLALLLLLASSAAAAAPSDPSPPPTTAAPAAAALPPAAFTKGPVREDALRLSRLLAPEDLYLQLMERSVVAGFDGAATDELAAMDKQHPGVLDEVKAELVKVMRDHSKLRMEAMHARYARAIASHFGTAEVVQLAGFYESRTGQKVIVGKFSGMDLSGVMDKLSESPNAPVTERDIRQLNRSAAKKIVPHLDTDDRAALLHFMQLPAFSKLAQFRPTMIALETQIAAEPDPELDQKIETAIASVMARITVPGETS